MTDLLALADRLEQGAENGDWDAMQNVVSALREAHATIERLCAEKVNDSEIISSFTETLRQVSDERDTLRAENQLAWNKCAEAEKERDALRELVREAVAYNGNCQSWWLERAEKALEGS